MNNNTNNEHIKLLFISPSRKSGGGIRVLMQLANGAADKGYEVHFVFPNNSDEYNSYKVSDKLKVVKHGKFKDTMAHKLRNLLSLVRYINKRYDHKKWIIIYSDPFTAVSAIFFRRFKQWRFVQGDDYHLFDDLRLLKKNWVLILYKVFTKLSYQRKYVNFLFNSETSYSQYLKIAHRRDVKKRIVHPGIDGGVFKPLGIRCNGTFKIMTIGRKHGIKGFKYFIEAVNQLKEKVDFDAVTVVSQDDLSEFDTGGMNVIVPQCDEDINTAYNTADVFVSTSEVEGFGMPALEAMATGCCVVTTATEGAKIYSENEENCLMVPIKNPNIMAEAIYLLYTNKGLRDKLSRNGIQTSLRFSIEKTVDCFLKYVVKE